jgi:P22 tail accessory factor
MGWAKRQFIQQAFNEIGLGSYFFDLSPEQLQHALVTLESMIGGFYTNGIMIGYPISGDVHNADIDEATDVPFNLTQPVYTNLAVALAPAYGKTPPPETKLAANNGYTLLCMQAAKPKKVRLPLDMPLGAGNKRVLYRYVEPEEDTQIDLKKPNATIF